MPLRMAGGGNCGSGERNAFHVSRVCFAVGMGGVKKLDGSCRKRSQGGRHEGELERSRVRVHALCGGIGNE